MAADDGQLIESRRVIIDQDIDALKELQSRNPADGPEHSVDVPAANFENVILFGDVVYFEFCLHEMPDPRSALTHASGLVPDIVVFDHSPGAEWVFLFAEEDKVRLRAQVIKRFGIRRCKTFRTEQHFAD